MKLNDGGYRTVYLHREIMGLGYGDKRTVDHINRNPLDNRRANLRVLTHAENMQNVPARGGTSRYRGVSWDSANRRWFTKVKINGHQKFLGYYDDEEEAARVVEKYRAAHMPYAHGRV